MSGRPAGRALVNEKGQNHTAPYTCNLIGKSSHRGGFLKFLAEQLPVQYVFQSPKALASENKTQKVILRRLQTSNIFGTQPDSRRKKGKFGNIIKPPRQVVACLALCREKLKCCSIFANIWLRHNHFLARC